MSLTSIARKVIPPAIRKPARRLIYAGISAERQRGKGYAQLKAFLEQAQWWDDEQIMAWQLEKLKATVRHAYEQVPGYRALYDAVGVRPDDLRTLADIELLPMLDKEMLRDNLEDFCSRDVSPWHRWQVHTSGSEGKPFCLYHADSSDWIEDAFMYAGWERAGWRLGDTLALIATEFVGTKERFWDYERARQMLHLSVYQLENETIQAYVDKINQVDARHIYGAPSAVVEFANRLVEAGLQGSVQARSVLMTSEIIEDWHMARLHEAFPSAHIFGWYGHTERAILAPWCASSNRYHVWPFYGYTEVLDGEGNEVGFGQRGELVGTSFWSDATPLVRYRTGDLAVRGENVCAECGRHGMILNAVEGRVRDVLISSQGRERALPPTMLEEIRCNVEQVQYYQDTPGQVIMRLVVTPGYSEDDAARIRRVVSSSLGEDMTLELETVSEIARTAAGKHRVLDQRIDHGGLVKEDVLCRSAEDG